MALKPSETYFTIPVRMYEDDNEEDPHGERDYILHKAQNKIPRYIVGHVDIAVEDIKLVGDTYSKYDDFDIVIKEGTDATLVTLHSGENIFCHWPRKKFRQEYDNHIEKLQLDLQEEMVFQDLYINDGNIKQIKAAVKDFETKRKQQKLKTKQTIQQ